MLAGRRRSTAPAPLDATQELPTSPRSVSRQAKLHRLLKKLHGQNGRLEEACAELGLPEPSTLVERALAGQAEPTKVPKMSASSAGGRGRGGAAAGRGRGSRGGARGAGGRAGRGQSAKPQPLALAPPPAAAAAAASELGNNLTSVDEAVKIEAELKGHRVLRGGQLQKKRKLAGRGKQGEDAGADAAVANGRHVGSAGGASSSGLGNGSTDVSASSSTQPDDEQHQSVSEPPCMFKSYSFTTASPPVTKYDFAVVPQCTSDLTDSVLLRPSKRNQWFVCVKELESLAKESLDRRALRLQLPPPSGLPLVYIADRMDIDDPLWGYQIRSKEQGWLQGFLTMTVFTTWTHYFEWNSINPASGMAAARIANSLVGVPDEAVEILTADATVLQVATRHGVKAAEIVSWNSTRLPSMHANSRLVAGTGLYVINPAAADKMVIGKKAESPRQIAARLGLETEDLLLLNSKAHPALSATTKLKPGTEILTRDRLSEPDVFLPTQKRERQLDGDGSLAADLQRQHRYGDPTTTGVVWPRIAEIALLAGLGCGKTLVRLVLDELAQSGEFDFVVLQATMASVSFYEEMGFMRVGALARYTSETAQLEASPLQGYRHWASADESQVEQFGEVSYMMALRLSALPTAKAAKMKPSKALAKRLVKAWPEVQSIAIKQSHKKGAAAISHHAAAIVGGDAMQVGDMSLNIAEGDDARLQLRWEVERVLEAREHAGAQQYLVKWKHCIVEDATWENATSDMFRSEAAKAALVKWRKHQHRKGNGEPSPVPGSPGHKRLWGAAAAQPPGPWWATRIVRLQRDPWAEGAVRQPLVFAGGVGEPPPRPYAPCASLAPIAEGGRGGGGERLRRGAAATTRRGGAATPREGAQVLVGAQVCELVPKVYLASSHRGGALRRLRAARRAHPLARRAREAGVRTREQRVAPAARLGRVGDGRARARGGGVGYR